MFVPVFIPRTSLYETKCFIYCCFKMKAREMIRLNTYLSSEICCKVKTELITTQRVTNDIMNKGNANDNGEIKFFVET